LTKVKPFYETVEYDKDFSKTVFSKSLKTVSDTEKRYEDKFVDLQIFNNALAWHIFISRTVFEIQGSKKTLKKVLILGKNYLDCAVQGRLSIPSWGIYFERVLTQVKTFLRPLAPHNFFPKIVFSKYLKNRKKY